MAEDSGERDGAEPMTSTILLAVLGMLSDLQIPVTIGALPAANAVSAYISSGYTDTAFSTKGRVMIMRITFIAKNANQQTALDALSDIHDALTLTKVYPEGTGYQVMDIQTDTVPNYIGREEDKQYTYGSTVAVRYFQHLKGE